jgi:tetratricopeptide (TPR) repeat protein
LLWNNKGYGLTSAKREVDSINAYRKAGELAWNRDAWILSNVADLFASNKDFASARKFALQASKLDPTLPDPWKTLAQEKYEAKDLKGAIDKLSEGIRIKPSPQLLASRIHWNLERNDVTAAAEDVIRLELLSDDIIVWGPPKFSLLSAQSKVTAAVNLADQIITEAEKRRLSADEIDYYRKQKQRLLRK